MYRILTNPDEFYRRRRDQYTVRWPVTILFLTGVMSVVGSAYVFYRIVEVFPESAQTVILTIGAFPMVSGLVANALLWVVYSGVFHLISAKFDGSGDFRRTLSFVGWGFVPTLIVVTAASAASIWVFSGVTFPSDPTAVRPFVRETSTSSPVLRTVRWLGVVFVLWRGMLWVFALKHARNLTLRQAGYTVALPTIGAALLAVQRIL